MYLWDSREPSPELFPLRGDANRTIVRVADSRHDAPGGDHCHGSKAELISAQQRAHDYIIAALQPAIGAEDDAIPL